jgi:hypothetical protein
MASQSSTPPLASDPAIDPVLRNTLRYTVSAREYKLLHDYLISRSPGPLKKRAPPPTKYEAVVKSRDDYNAAAIRAALRVFLATGTGLKAWEMIMGLFFGRGKPKRSVSRSLTCVLMRVAHCME